MAAALLKGFWKKGKGYAVERRVLGLRDTKFWAGWFYTELQAAHAADLVNWYLYRDHHRRLPKHHINFPASYASLQQALHPRLRPLKKVSSLVLPTNKHLFTISCLRYVARMAPDPRDGARIREFLDKNKDLPPFPDEDDDRDRDTAAPSQESESSDGEDVRIAPRLTTTRHRNHARVTAIRITRSMKSKIARKTTENASGIHAKYAAGTSETEEDSVDEMDRDTGVCNMGEVDEEGEAQEEDGYGVEGSEFGYNYRRANAPENKGQFRQHTQVGRAQKKKAIDLVEKVGLGEGGTRDGKLKRRQLADHGEMQGLCEKGKKRRRRRRRRKWVVSSSSSEEEAQLHHDSPMSVAAPPKHDEESCSDDSKPLSQVFLSKLSSAPRKKKKTRDPSPNPSIPTCRSRQRPRRSRKIPRFSTRWSEVDCAFHGLPALDRPEDQLELEYFLKEMDLGAINSDEIFDTQEHEIIDTENKLNNETRNQHHDAENEVNSEHNTGDHDDRDMEMEDGDVDWLAPVRDALQGVPYTGIDDCAWSFEFP